MDFSGNSYGSLTNLNMVGNGDQQLEMCRKRYDQAKDYFVASAEDLVEEMEGDTAGEQLADYVRECDSRERELKEIQQELVGLVQRAEVQNITKEYIEIMRKHKKVRAKANRLLRGAQVTHTHTGEETRAEDSASKVRNNGDVSLNDFQGFGEPGATATSTAEDVGGRISRVNSGKGSVQGGAPSWETPVTTQTNTRLAKLTVEEYHGDIVGFWPWFEQFNNLVGDTNIAPVEKMQRLVAACKDSAAVYLARFQVRAENYQPAMDGLMDRFGRYDVIKQEVLRKLRDLEIPHGTGKAYVDRLFGLHDEVMIALTRLEQVGLGGPELEKVLCHEVLGKIPSDIRARWCVDSNTKGNEDNLRDAMRFLEREATGLRRCGSYTDTKQERGATAYPLRGTASALVASNSGSNGCAICGKTGHREGGCKDFSAASLQMRCTIVDRHRLCRRCLRRGGVNHNCNWTCHECTGPHHTKLCNLEKPQANPRSDTQAQGSLKLRPEAEGYIPVSQLQQGQMPPMLPNLGPRSFENNMVQERVAGPALTSMGYSTKEAALQTAKVYMKTPDGSLLEATAILDTGSSGSYISKKVAKAIKPHLLGRDWLSYSAFGGD